MGLFLWAEGIGGRGGPTAKQRKKSEENLLEWENMNGKGKKLTHLKRKRSLKKGVHKPAVNGLFGTQIQGRGIFNR